MAATTPIGAPYDEAVARPERRWERLVGAAELRREVGVVPQPVDEVLELALRLEGRLPLLVDEGVDEPLPVCLEELEALPQDLGSRLGVGARPLRERRNRRLHRPVDVLRRSARNSPYGLLRRGIENLELLPAQRSPPLASDQHLRHSYWLLVSSLR